MSKGQRGVGLNKPCPKCGTEVPAMYKSPVQEGLCGKCTDLVLRKRKPQVDGASRGFVQAVPGGGSTIVGFAVGLALGILLCLLLAVFAPGFWASLAGGLGGIFGR